MLYATDTVSLDDVHVSDSGYLEAFARTVRTGCQQYLGAELKRPDLGIVTVYRDEADVFSHDSLHSFAQIPVTLDHPPGGVNARNWRQVARGTTGNEVLRDGQYLRLGLKVKDAEAVQAVRDGKCELSAGYRCELLWGDGVAPDGTKYQARQVGIVADHVAIVAKGRAGAACRIGDAAWPTDGARGPDQQGEPRDPHQHKDAAPMNMKTLTIDGHSVELSDAALIAVSGLQRQVGTLTTDNLKLTADLNTVKVESAKAVEAKDGEILKLQADHKVALDAKDAEIATLKADALTADKLDAAVAERAAVLDAAKPVLGTTFDAKGKTVADIRRATVAKRLGDAAVAGKTDEHVTIAFDTLTKVAPVTDAFRTAVTTGPVPIQAGDSAGAYEAMKQRLSNQYLPKTA